MLGMLTLLSTITDGAGNNLVFDPSEAILSPFLGVRMVGFVFALLFVGSVFASLLTSPTGMFMSCMSRRALQLLAFFEHDCRQKFDPCVAQHI